MNDSPATPDVAYIYDGTLEGLLCAIFDCFARKERPADVVTARNAQLRLGQTLHEVKTDLSHATRVRDGLIRVCGHSVYDAIRTASVSDDPRTGTICTTFACYAMNKNKRRWKDACGSFFDATMAIADPAVEPLFSLHRSVTNERHQWIQFLRFEELEGGIWYARCKPNASVVPLLMDYFAARFNTQAFVIYDETHNLAGVYEGGLPDRKRLTGGRPAKPVPVNEGQLTLDGGQAGLVAATTLDNRRNAHQGTKAPTWYLVQSDALNVPEKTDNEQAMSEAWRRFYRALSINDRYHPELRRQHMPVRFWGNLTELQTA